MPSANTLPERRRPAALTMSSGVTWLSVPIWSSLPQRPQFDSFLDASAMASLPTLMFMEPFPVSFVLAVLGAILRWSVVFLQAGSARIGFDRPLMDFP